MSEDKFVTIKPIIDAEREKFKKEISTLPLVPNGLVEILHPNLHNRFRIGVVGVDDVTAKTITSQTVSVSELDLSTSYFRRGKVDVVFEDDVTNHAYSAILKLQEKRFDLQIIRLNGNEGVIRMHTLKNVRVEKVRTVGFDYGCAQAAYFTVTFSYTLIETI
jgi:hypothetical protein